MYFDEHGNIDVPKDTVLSDGKDGKSIALWITVQRRYYREGKLTEKQIKKLNLVGMALEIADSWEIGFAHAEEYRKVNGDLLVPCKYICADGYPLGKWILNQRNNHNNPTKYHNLTVEQAKRLEQIGMVWDKCDNNWNMAYKLATDYYRVNGNLHVSGIYKAKNGFCLGSWVYSQRKKSRKGELPDEYKQKLDEIGMDWLFPLERKWEDGFAAAEEYYAKHGNLDVPEDYRLGDFSLGAWIKKQRKEKSSLKTAGANGNQISRLVAIGMIWGATDTKATADDTNHKISIQAMAV